VRRYRFAAAFGTRTRRSWQGWLYLGAVMDCYSRRIFGWSMRPDLEAELVVDALEMAIARRQPQPGLVHHSD
jgi:transposase InsO family protein